MQRALASRSAERQAEDQRTPNRPPGPRVSPLPAPSSRGWFSRRSSSCRPFRSVGLAWPITHPEGATIAAILRVRDGQPLYQDFLQYPHLITPYPPVQPVGVGLMSRLLGLSILETIGLARSLTLASALAATLLIWLIARRLGAGRLAALAGATFFLPLPFLDEWGFAARPDVPAVALSLLALLLLVIRPRQVWLAAVVAVLALFTKQTAVALPVAATLWLLLSRRWRDAAVFVGTWVVLTGGTVALLNAATGGTYVLNTVLAHLNTPKNGFDLALRDFQPLLHDDWLPLGLSVAAALLPGRPGTRRAAAPLPRVFDRLWPSTRCATPAATSTT